MFARIGHDGIEVVEEDWDVLVVLDACRYDVFEEVNWLDGVLHKKISRGSGTLEWLTKNFTGRYEDIIYVTANPHVSDVEIKYFRGDGFSPGEHFQDFIPVYLDDEKQEGGATSPEAVTEVALEVIENHPEKRVIVHYIQPHDPYIGDSFPASTTIEMRDEGKPWWWVQERYKANLERALLTIEELVNRFGSDRELVVTSDHGECFGEYGLVRHPIGVYVDELVEVPWLRITNES